MTRPLFALAIALVLVGSLVAPAAAAPEGRSEAPAGQLTVARPRQVSVSRWQRPRKKARPE